LGSAISPELVFKEENYRVVAGRDFAERY